MSQFLTFLWQLLEELAGIILQMRCNLAMLIFFHLYIEDSFLRIT